MVLLFNFCNSLCNLAIFLTTFRLCNFVPKSFTFTYVCVVHVCPVLTEVPTDVRRGKELDLMKLVFHIVVNYFIGNGHKLESCFLGSLC